MITSGADDRRADRGLVTVELALSTVALAIIIVLACWGLFLVSVQLRCIDTASAVARQSARGDRAGLAAAEAAAPEGAVVRVETTGDTVRVTVATAVRAPAPFVSAVRLQADATAVVEPGEQR